MYDGCASAQVAESGLIRCSLVKADVHRGPIGDTGGIQLDVLTGGSGRRTTANATPSDKVVGLNSVPAQTRQFLS